MNETVEVGHQLTTMPRVLMVAARYFPFSGGVETHVHEVGRRLVQMGVDLTVATTDPSGTLPEREIVAGMQIVRVRAYPHQRDWYYAPELTKIIQKGAWDVVHLQGSHTLVAPLVMRAARRARLPYVVTFHTGGHSLRLRAAMRDWQWRLLRGGFTHARRLISVSAFEASYFQRVLGLPASRFTIIPNGGTLPALPDPADLPPKNGTLLVSVGRLERYKGHQCVIAALPHVIRDFPDAHLLILGAGPYEHALYQQVDRLGLRSHVQIRSIPASERRTMAGTLAQADLVTLLSDYEAHPIAVMEALALRRPLVVTATSGLQEFADAGQAIAVPRDSSPQQTAQAITSQLRAPLIASAFTLPTWEHCAQQLCTLYQEIRGS